MSRFSKLNKLVNCDCCGKLTHSSIESIGIGLCRVCYESAGLVNEHSDNGGHNPKKKDCPTCQGVDCLHELAAVRS